MNVRAVIGFLSCAISLASPAAATWFEARTGNFIVLSDTSEAGIRDLATKLERFDQGLRKTHGLPAVTQPRSNPLTVYVLSSIGAVRDLCRGRIKKGCANVAGFYHGSVEGSTAFTPRQAGDSSPLDLSAQTVLFHEYVHHFLQENWTAAYPAWFSEGYAEFYGASTFDRDGALGFGQIANHRLFGLLTGKPLPLPLAQMLAAERAPKGEFQVDALYGRGWLLTHYLTFEPKRDGQLIAYLDAINHGMRGRAAAEKAFGDIAMLDRELDAYLKHRYLKYRRLSPTALSPVAVTIRPLPPGEAAIMPVRMQSDGGVNETSAPLVVAKARPIAARFPNDGGVQATLAEAEYDAGHDDEAEAAADRALALDPRSYGAMLYKGRARIRRLTRSGGDAAAWREARSWFIRANATDHDAAAALKLFYESFVAEGQKPTKNAINALEKAQTLVPQDEDLRWLTVTSLVDRGELAKARDMLAPLAFDPHAPEDNPFASVLAAFDAGDATAARAAVADMKEKRRASGRSAGIAR